MNYIKNKVKKFLAMIIVFGFLFNISPNTGLLVLAEDENWIDYANVEWYESNPDKDTYEISTAEQLAGLAKIVNDGITFSGKTLLLNNDLDLLGKQWTPIGFTDKPFSGVFDGQNQAINNICIDTERCEIGLFGIVSSCEIKNIRMIDSSIKGMSYVGSIVGSASENSSIINCYNTGTVIGGHDISINGIILTRTGGNHIGGIAGSATSVVNCHNNGEVVGTDCVGGIVSSAVSVVNCHNTAKVSGKDCVGGIIGSAPSFVGPGGMCGSIPEIKNCYNEGDVNGNNNVGGILGEGVRAVNCHNKGTVIGKGNCVGGVIGNSVEKDSGMRGVYRFSPSMIENCHNTGTVIGNNNAGGVVGCAKNNISNCYNTGTVKKNDDCSGGENGKNIGGVVGKIGGTLLNCYNTGTVSGDERVGGVIGCSFSMFNFRSCYPPTKSRCYTPVENCYSIGNVIGNVDVGGVIGYTEKDSPVKNCYYIGANVGIGNLSDSSAKVMPFANLYLNRETISINGSAYNKKNNTEIATRNLNGSEKMGTGFKISISLESDNCEVATADATKVNGIAEGVANIRSKLVITQNTLTDNGWTGAPETIESNLVSSAITVQGPTCIIA